MRTHERKVVFCVIILACTSIHHFSIAYSRVRKIAIPEQPIEKEALQRKVERDGSLNLGTNEKNRRLKSGKDFKTSKKSKNLKTYSESYYKGSYYTNSYPLPRMPVQSPTFRQRIRNYSEPTNKAASFYDPTELSEYESYSDMIDYYYIKHSGDTNSIDESIEPSLLPPTLPPVKRPDMDSPIWSYSEDEKTDSPSIVPTSLPSLDPQISPPPSMGQCMVRVMLDQCSSLLQSVEPIEECDCYNFCGGIYLGCCSINDPCPLSCEVLGGFVAGCRFGYTSSPVTVNPTENEVPSMSPFAKPAVSEEPTLPGTSSTSKGTSTEIPQPSQTIKPSTLSPTQVFPTPSEGTSMPTTDFVSISLELFTLEYEIAFSRPIAQSDVVVLTSITNSYLQVYMSGAFQSDLIIMADFVTGYNSFLEDPGSSVVLVTFKSTAFFNPSTQELPSRIDLERELASAFQGVALAGYLGRVQALPASNAFSKSSQIFIVQNAPTVSSLESREFSSVAAATAIFAVAIITSLASFSWYRTRRRQRRLEASENFLSSGSGFDSKRETNIGQNKEDIELNQSERRLSVTLLENIRRIEDMGLDSEDQSKDTQFMDRDNISRRSGFESDETYLYEDDTIEDEDNSMY